MYFVQLGGEITKYIRYLCRVNYHCRSREKAKKRLFISICHAQTRQIIYLKENKHNSGPTVSHLLNDNSNSPNISN